MSKEENKNTGQDHDLEHRLKLRNLKMSDYMDVKDIMKIVYKQSGGPWTRVEYKRQLSVFPEGQICIEDNGKVVAAAMSLIVNYPDFGDKHTYNEITGYGKFDTHNPEGDTLYGTDIFVDPNYQGMRLGRRLYDARKELCENLNLRAIIIGGRIPVYNKYKDQLTPREFIEEVKNREIYDPVLSFQLSNDFHIRKVITGYMPEDKDSSAYAILMEWINIYYEEDEKLIGGRKTQVRIGAVQWQMRRVGSVDDLLQQVEFFVDSVSGYSADFVVFPEFFNAPVMAMFDDANPAESVRMLSEYSEYIREEIMNMAVSYNINIIAGSIPEYNNHKLYNVSYLLRRDGSWDAQYKLHITPDEQLYWGLQGGYGINVFDTDAGRIGILICYDVEFPEVSRIMAEYEMEILFVPYWTDTKNAYLRVRRCSQSRAIENECYVVITGSVGNLPRVENMDIQYSQSAVFSPSDFSFPHDAVIAEATPNTETMLVADLDLDLLKRLRRQGSVRNLQQRRQDLYTVKYLEKKPKKTTRLKPQVQKNGKGKIEKEEEEKEEEI